MCRDPVANVYCTAHEHIRLSKRDSEEAEHAGKHLSETSFRPPCSRDPGAYSSSPYELRHSDPLEWRGLGTVTEELPAYSVSTSPYGHMFSEGGGWEYDRDTQVQRLSAFFEEIEPSRSLIFFYLKDGQPFLETSQRIICGVGRVAKVGPQLTFPGTYQGKTGYPVWARAITQSFPEEGFRLPLQEYWAAQRIFGAGLCVVPPHVERSFSYVAEHVSDDTAVTMLELLIDSARWFKSDAYLVGWDGRVEWLERALAGVWRERGPYPGIPAVLGYLGCTTGTTYLRERAARGTLASAWADLKRTLDGSFEDIPARHASGLIRASERWRALPESRRDVLGLLARMDITTAQVERVAHPDQRADAGIDASDEALLGNPYRIAEADLGTDESDPLAFETIDHALLPAPGHAAHEPIARQDDRRVRAALHDVLREASSRGDTVLRAAEASELLGKRFATDRGCLPDWDVVSARREFYEESLWFNEGAITTVATRAMAEDEQLLRVRFGRLASKRLEVKNVNWEAIIDRVLSQARSLPSEDDKAAREEKQRALARASRFRLSVITGRAGTGKTTVARALLDGIEEAEGKTGFLLLAPTGKARIRLEKVALRPASTIHQLLAETGWIQFGNAFALKRSGGALSGASTVLIDEMSMVPTDLLATLFRAIDWNQVRRLVLMGDVNQLPPIGPGRPFADVIDWLSRDAENREQVVRLEQRGRFVDAHSLALQLSDGYVSGGTPPAGDDEMLAKVARRDLPPESDLEVYYWDDPNQLTELLNDRLLALVLGGRDNYDALNASLRRGDEIAPEQWQILSPVRRQPFGTDEMNRAIQLKYRRGLIEKAQRRAYMGKYQLARPAGDQQIVWTDKVIQVMNERRRAWSTTAKAADRHYVANGEVGVVTTAIYSNKRDQLKVTFGTQPDLQFQYSRGAAGEKLELAYAITVHKSQGSDFDVVFLVMPQEAGTLSRELIYTALTRFRVKLVLLLERDVRVLQQHRRPATSETVHRNTHLFELRVRPEGMSRIHPEHLIHRTTTGDLVRSKSELVVAETLRKLPISFKYEEPLYSRADRTDFRIPDFTISYEGDTWYWEHLGMLSIPSYTAAWERKKAWYEREGLIDQVITSEDGPDGSLDAQRIEQTARERILGGAT